MIRVFTQTHIENLRRSHLGKKSTPESNAKRRLSVKLAHQIKEFGFKKGVIPKHTFSKGHIPWSKKVGGTGILKAWNKGKPGLRKPNPTPKRIREQVESKLWRLAVFERDDFVCQMPGCGKRGGDIEPHHIKRFVDFPKLRFEVTNGITLCKPCHNLTKNKELKFEKLFNEILCNNLIKPFSFTKKQ